MTDAIVRARIWQGVPVDSRSLQANWQTESNSGATRIRFTANITKADFNRDVNVDVRSISGERIQAQQYEVPEAIVVSGDGNQEHPFEQLVVDAQPLPWYIRIEFWKLCVIAIFIVSVIAVAIVLLSTNVSSSSTSSESLSTTPTKSAPTSFPTYDITSFSTKEPSLKPSTKSDKEYIAMQRDILEQIYIETDGGNSWYTSDNWLNDEVSVCEWYGCECNDTDNDVVTSFIMPNIKVPQKVPTVLGLLNELQVLTITNANFVGTLPSELFRLHQLKRMNVISSLNGTLPLEMGELRSLEYLELRDNSFGGQIPTELGLLQSLTYLHISDHKYFTEASIPSEFGNLSSLKTLHLSRNGLRGVLPSELFGLVSLEELNLSENSLNGPLPLSLDLMSLREMDLSRNLFTGMLPGALGSLESLEVLRMDVSSE